MSGPVLNLSHKYADTEVLAWLDKWRHEPGATIQGQGESHSIIKVPVSYDCPYPDIRDCTVDLRDVAHDGAAVEFINPGKSHSKNLTIQNENRGGIALREVLKERVNTYPWPPRGQEAPSTIASLSLHENLTISTAYGGGIELRQEVPKDVVGHWMNHFRVIGGQINDVTPSGKALGFATDGEQGGGKWEEYYEWRPMIGLYSAQISLSMTHADLWGQRIDKTPIYLEDIGGGNQTRLMWNGGMEYGELKAKKHDKWLLDGKFRPLFGGPALGQVYISEPVPNLRYATTKDSSLFLGPWRASCLLTDYFANGAELI